MLYVVFVKCLLLVVLVGLFFQCCEGSSLQNHLPLQRWKRQACGTGMFRCETGECISMTLVCNGEKNCKDRSDETTETCINSVMPVIASYLNPNLISYIDKCPPNEFQCDSGRCIHGTKRCDNKKDCFDGSDEKECENLCRSGGFKCTSGTCLAIHQICNGAKDCEDGSDETPQQCQSKRCAVNQFTCGYGACIEKNAVCDNKNDCVDGSDENAEMCKLNASSPPPRVTENCILPPQPENGEYLVGGCNPPSCYATPGKDIGNIAILSYTCHSGYKLSGSQLVWCNNGAWPDSFPTCKRALCSILKNPTRNFECKRRGENVNCNEPALPGTQANILCKTFYTSSPEISNYIITCSDNGTWSNVVHSCTPECGFPTPGGLPFISNGVVTKVAEYPWHVGIYKIIGDTFQQMCGGSIVRPGVVISAAHCFWNELENRPHDAGTYKITAGKYYRDWNKRTRYFQEVEIEKVILSRSFRGSVGLYADDIAVVILKTNFIMNDAVRPICVDLNRRYNEDFKPGRMGVILGWGFTENQTPSEELKAITLPYEDRDVCINRTKETFVQFLNVRDKFCVGTNVGKSVCPGDSGGGFATKFRDGERYYLMGIVSVGVAPDGSDNCDIFQYSTFTKVSEHYLFIRQYMSL